MRSQTPAPTTVTGGTRRRRGVLAAVTVGTLALGVLAATPAQAAPVVVDVYGFNDFHGRLERGAAPRDGEQGVAGAATMAAAFAQYRTANPNSIFVSSGDNVGASTFTSFIQDDAPTLTALNQMGLDVSAIGNHEFDKGQDDLTGRIEPAADFPYLAANVVDTATGAPAFDAYAIEERDGKRIAFVGAVTELMPELVSPTGIAGLEFTDIATTVSAYAEALTNGEEDALTGTDEADAVVLLVHEGGETSAAPTDDSTTWGDIVFNTSPAVDAILSAHTHQQYDYTVVPRGGTTPRPVIQTGSYSGALSHLQFAFDDADVSVKSVRSLGNVDLYRTTFASGSAEEAAVAATVAEAVRVAQAEGAREVGRITGPFLRAVQPAADGTTTENRGGESTAGNFVADVQLAATRANGAVMAFMNPGGLRADLSGTGGVVNYQQAAAVQPFANTLVVVDMTGAQVVEALEQQWQPAGSSRPFLKLGASAGVQYTYDPAAAQGERVSRVTLDGVELDPTATYKVTVNSFLAGGGDNFGAFADGAARADSGKVDLQAQVEYFQALQGEAASPDFAQRAVGVQVTPAPEGGFAAGDEVTLQLSSLVMSQAAPETGAVSVSLDGEVLASSDVDATLVPTNDEQGRATLTFTVPESAVQPAADVSLAAVEERALVVTVAGTGTTVEVPIALAVADVVVPDPGTPTDPGAGTPGTPGTPGAPGTGTGTGAGAGAGAGTGSSATAGGPLAFTGSELATGGLVAALVLLLAGAGALTATRLRRRGRDDEQTVTTTD